ncbi:MAG: hypothetical protein U5L09_15305 [Bacteroidales bacterium]|nr:hypothetical protein [Bacteroidales bacterium]
MVPHEEITVALLVMAMSCVVMAEMRQSDFLVYHPTADEARRLCFSFSGKAVIRCTSKESFAVCASTKSYGALIIAMARMNTMKGSRLFNGKEITYFFDQEKYFIAGDTLFKFVITNRLSADSIDVLFGRKSKNRRFSKSEV